ncbi:patatin-like phospholipase family protein [Niveibacterium sp.]|uniref:patatin-like phospholipase family protein n=1 Tax=Niveibacterium sp. TaxID=2017444 RepID=UPI0035B186E8
MIFGKRAVRRLNLALQGGGAHGAFTWGVLDRLLEDGRMRFDGVSGTSAGAMNAVMLAQGLSVGGADGARQALADFWSAVARSLPFDVTLPAADGQGVVIAPPFKMMLQWTHYLSPDQLNPFDLNPLRDIVSAQVDFARLRRASPVKLFIATTHANSGKLRVFRNAELSADVVLASACLPTLHRAIVIDDEPYWDGGYAANPAVFPLFYECVSRDILLVLLTPLKHAETPASATDIRCRILEIAFNSTFLREMRMFAHLRDYTRRSWLPLGRFERRVSQTRFHLIGAEDLLGALPAETKLAANMQFFEMLRDQGRARADDWLQAHAEQVGRHSSVDLGALFY